MFLAVHPPLAALDVEERSLCAGVMRTHLFDDVHHAVLGMLLAKTRRLPALDIEARSLCTGVMCASLHKDTRGELPAAAHEGKGTKIEILVFCWEKIIVNETNKRQWWS